jgi:hypothetical protein
MNIEVNFVIIVQSQVFDALTDWDWRAVETNWVRKYCGTYVHYFTFGG